MGNINSWFATHVHVIWDMCTGIFSIERNCCHRSCLVMVMFSKSSLQKFYDRHHDNWFGRSLWCFNFTNETWYLRLDFSSYRIRHSWILILPGISSFAVWRVPSTEQDMLTLPEHLMSPRVRFFWWRFILQELQFLCRLIHVHFYSLCSVVFVYPSLLSCSCVISILPCLWILSFLNNPFTLFLWKSVAYTWTF